MKPRLIVVCVSLVTIVAFACQTPLPQRQPLDPLDPRPGTLLSTLEDTASARTSLQGALRLSLDAPGLHFRRPQRLALRRPTDLRIEILGLFGQIAAVLVTHGETYQTFDASSGNFESGQVRPDLLWRIARVALRPQEAVDLLLGVPMPSAETSFAGAYTAPHRGVSLDFRDRQGRLRERFVFDVEGRLSEFVRYARSGDIAWEASFDDYRDLSGSFFAFEVRLKFPELDARASLRFDHVALGPELADELFTLRIPEHADPQ